MNPAVSALIFAAVVSIGMAILGGWSVHRSWRLGADHGPRLHGARRRQKVVTIEMDRLVFGPTVSRRFNERYELLAGGRISDS